MSALFADLLIAAAQIAALTTAVNMGRRRGGSNPRCRY
jgi:hypothetical protein